MSDNEPAMLLGYLESVQCSAACRESDACDQRVWVRRNGVTKERTQDDVARERRRQKENIADRVELGLLHWWVAIEVTVDRVLANSRSLTSGSSSRCMDCTE